MKSGGDSSRTPDLGSCCFGFAWLIDEYDLALIPPTDSI